MHVHKISIHTTSQDSWMAVSANHLSVGSKSRSSENTWLYPVVLVAQKSRCAWLDLCSVRSFRLARCGVSGDSPLRKRCLPTQHHSSCTSRAAGLQGRHWLVSRLWNRDSHSSYTCILLHEGLLQRQHPPARGGQGLFWPRLEVASSPCCVQWVSSCGCHREDDMACECPEVDMRSSQWPSCHSVLQSSCNRGWHDRADKAGKPLKYHSQHLQEPSASYPSLSLIMTVAAVEKYQLSSS